MITVMGATGNVGRRITERLLAGGEQVRAVGRNPGVLAALADAGADPLAGDVSDPAFLTGAFSGADAVHTMLPFDPASPDFRGHQDRLGAATAAAVRGSGVAHVVAQSSLGAGLPAGTGFLSSLHDQEQRLRALPGVNVLFLRPGLFQETIAAAAEVIGSLGIHADAVAPDVPVPMIATRDVAEVAAAALRGRDWSGHQVRELLGPRDLTYREATRILGAVLGRPDLDYVRLPDEQMIAALVEAGFSPDAAGLQVAMGRALSDRTIVSRQGRSALTSTPTRFEDVVAELIASTQVPG